MTTPKPITLFIGLDGATFTVLDDLTRDAPGRGVTMPFLKSLFERGTRARLKSTPHPLTPPAWTSIMTGRGPGHHGVYDFMKAQDRGHDVWFTLSDSRDIDAETIWSVASRKGLRVAALNFPLTAPPEAVNGSIVPGFVPAKHLRRNCHPKDLFERLKAIPDFDPKELAWDFERELQSMDALGEEGTEAWVRYHLPREEQWMKIAEHLLAEDRPDLMAVLFDGADKIQHQAWAFLDPALLSPQPDAWQARMRELCLSYFRALDGYLRRLVELAGPGSRVFLASDHGFTASTEVLRINSFLHDKGYLHWRAPEDSEQRRKRDQAHFANVDWERTVAYCRTPSSNGIWIRVAHAPGEPGVPPAEYGALRDRLIRDLRALADERTGEPLVREVLKREDWFAGAHMQEAPDLTLVLRDHGFVSIRDLKPARVDRERPAGTHHPDGVFIACGEGIAAAGLVERRNILDVAPTLLYSLGLPVPKDFEGQVPAEFFTLSHRAAQPVKAGAPTRRPERAAQPGQREMSPQEREQIVEQLRALGYME